MMPLKEHYKTNVVSELKEKLNLESVMAVPKVMKVTLNMGVGEAMNDKKILERYDKNVTACGGEKWSRSEVAKWRGGLGSENQSPHEKCHREHSQNERKS